MIGFPSKQTRDTHQEKEVRIQHFAHSGEHKGTGVESTATLDSLAFVRDINQ